MRFQNQIRDLESWEYDIFFLRLANCLQISLNIISWDILAINYNHWCIISDVDIVFVSIVK